MDKEYWNNYYKQEVAMCLKYKMPTSTIPTLRYKNNWGIEYCESVNIEVNNAK